MNGDSRWLAFEFEGVIRYLHASLATMTSPTLAPTSRPATATLTFRPGPPETFYIFNAGGANARPCPHLTETCASVRRFNYRDQVTVVGEVQGDEYQGSRRWKVVDYGNQLLYIHATLLSPNRPSPDPPGGGTGGSGSSGGSSVGGNTSAPYVSGSCRVVREKTGQCGFRPGDPNYRRGRDRDEDGIACEC